MAKNLEEQKLDLYLKSNGFPKTAYSEKQLEEISKERDLLIKKFKEENNISSQKSDVTIGE